MPRFHQGFYKPKNPSKFISPDNIVYRSGWERSVMHALDMHPKVLKVGSEPFPIKYFSTVKNRMAKYWPDFYLEIQTESDGIIKMVVEVKPSKETKPPRKYKNQARFLRESLTYITNQNKWIAAKKFCDERGILFEIWNEAVLKSLGILIST